MKLLDAALAAAVTEGAKVFGNNFRLWCTVNKIPRSTAYRHRKRVIELGRWEPLSTRPKTRAAHATPVDVEAEIVRLRAELAEIPGQDCGADSVGYYLLQVAELESWAARGIKVPSRATIHKIMKRHGLVTPEPKKRPKSSYRRFAYARPRDCYQIDATQVQLAGGATAVVFHVLDDCTRTAGRHAGLAGPKRRRRDRGGPARVHRVRGSRLGAGRQRHRVHLSAHSRRHLTVHPVRPRAGP